MTEDKKEDPKPKAEEKKAPAAPKKEKIDSTSPRVNKDLPQGIFGGPATLGNPAEENVVVRPEER